ncbi:unnamed protein product [Moneuplotes crassus]|uniref:Uncharacterized protein n=1 Tax=Euplotes crassus TaxID=5936 RepID=A0AAD1UUN9_EUPCR|nr:unnamed protein product [Moneuplotes crassus]
MGSSQSRSVLPKIGKKSDVVLDKKSSCHSKRSLSTQGPLQLTKDFEELAFYETLTVQTQRALELYTELVGPDYPIRVSQINGVLGTINEHMERSKWKYQGAHPDDYKIRYIDMGVTVSTLYQRCHKIMSKAEESMLMLKASDGSGLPIETTKKLSFEEEIHSESLKLDTDMCTKLYIRIVSGYMCEGRNINYLYFTNKNEKKYLEQSSTLTQAGSSNFFIDNVPALNRRSKMWLKNCFPVKAKRFRFNGRNDRLLDISFYLKDVTSVSHRVIKEVHLCNFSINEVQLKKLLYAYRFIKGFMLKKCKIMTPTVPNLDKALKGCGIRNLNFEFCGHSKFSDWAHNLYQFENLIHGLSQTDILLSLRQINLESCEIDEMDVKRQLKKYGFKKVKIQGFTN